MRHCEAGDRRNFTTRLAMSTSDTVGASSVAPKLTQIQKPWVDSPCKRTELIKLILRKLSVLLLFLTQKYRVQFLQNVFFLINQDILLSLSDSSASVAGFPFFPLPETKRCLESLLKFRLLCSFGAYRQIVHLNEDQSVHASAKSVVHVQTGFQQRLSISLLDEPSCQSTMPSKRGIVETVYRGNKLNEGPKWQVQTLARLHKQRTSRAIQRVRLTERVFEVCNRQRQITQLQQKKGTS